MKKVLFTANVSKHIKSFHIPYIKWFKEHNFEVHVASNGEDKIEYIDKQYNIDIKRSPYKLSNLKAYLKLKKIINNNDYELIHCHTPMGGVLTRLASIKARKNGTILIYTAHGFHFYKGAAFKNWLLYYPVEKFLSRLTDVLITINKEDYNTAINRNFKSEKITLINGVGVNLEQFEPVSNNIKFKLRKKYGYHKNDFILIYVAALSKRKNQIMLINVINRLKNKIPNLKLLLVGTGDLEEFYKDKVNKLNLNEYIDFLGYRDDIPNLMKLSDVSVSTSKQEGLPVNIMEAMATGLPVVATNCRGNRDLIKHNLNGYISNLYDNEDFKDNIIDLYKNKNKLKSFGENSLELINDYSLKEIKPKYIKIYKDVLNFHF